MAGIGTCMTVREEAVNQMRRWPCGVAWQLATENSETIQQMWHIGLCSEGKGREISSQNSKCFEIK